MVRTGENRMRGRRREPVRAAISPHGLVAPGRDALRPLQNIPERSALQRAGGHGVRLGSLGDPDRRSVEGPGVHRRGLSGAA